MLTLKLGFRNLWRNKRRSLLTGFAVGLGLAALMLMDGFWKGMTNNMIKAAISSYIGHAQIHHKKFQESFDTEYYLSGDDDVLDLIKNNREVESYSLRTLSLGMISSSNESLNVQVIGINPEQEVKVSYFDDRMIAGNYINELTDIVIGKRLQEKLGVELEERLVVTVSDVKTGDLKQELFRLKGVFGTGAKDLDQGVVLLHQEKLQELLNLKGFHEVTIVFKSKELAEKNESFIKQLNKGQIKAESWKELIPQIVAVIEMSSLSIGILGTVLFILVAMGILNTMFMSLFERTYEFGVLKAIGTKKHELFALVCAESLALACVSIAFGVAITCLIGFYWMKVGLDYSGIQFGEITFTEKIYFVFAPEQFYFYPAVLLVFTVVISLYPAWKTIKINTAHALQRSL